MKSTAGLGFRRDGDPEDFDLPGPREIRGGNLGNFINSRERPRFLELFRYLGPGFLVTVGFIDPGNWAANVAAGSQYGYTLLWVVTLSTLMLILLQHNAAHLGIVTGLCLSEAASKYFGRGTSRVVLFSAVGASVSTALAEILGTAIGLNMLFRLPLNIGAALAAGLAIFMLFSNRYAKLEMWIIGFVSLIGLAFLIEMSLVRIEWGEALKSLVTPRFPEGALPIIMSVLGAVVMPHNIFLHSEVIQSRQWNLRGEKVIARLLKFEFVDTLAAMLAGWGINSAMILVTAAVFHSRDLIVTELPQAQATLGPLLGSGAAVLFALALLFSGFSSSITAGMAGGSIFAGIFQKPFQLDDGHSRLGVFITLLGALTIIFFLKDPFQGILWSQIILSIQLPLTILPLIRLTSSRKVMGEFANSRLDNFLLGSVSAVVLSLNLMLLIQLF
jgi:manganese transport protein